MCRKQESRTGVQHDSDHVAQHTGRDDPMLHMQQKQTSQDKQLKQHGCDDTSKAAAKTSAMKVEKPVTAAHKGKKRSASRTDERSSEVEKVADRTQTESEAISGGRCNASKRQRPENRASS